MTAVPTYNFILNKVDSLTRLTDSILSVQLMQNAKMDSVCDIASQLSETQIALQSQTETVSDQIQKISEYGIGYSDVVAHITIPLVIALFAFAMWVAPPPELEPFPPPLYAEIPLLSYVLPTSPVY